MPRTRISPERVLSGARLQPMLSHTSNASTGSARRVGRAMRLATPLTRSLRVLAGSKTRTVWPSAVSRKRERMPYLAAQGHVLRAAGRRHRQIPRMRGAQLRAAGKHVAVGAAHLE